MSASPKRRLVRWLGASGLVSVGLLAIVWSERTNIGAALVDRKLAAADVRARYRITDLGLGRQRLVDVVIGDPKRPDLVADWIELRTRLGLDGVAVTAVKAGGLRLRASLVDGRLSLGEIDRLLPASTGAGSVRLPAINLDVADARAQVATGYGPVALSLTGSGRLDGGFRGRALASGARLAVAGCNAAQPRFEGAVSTAAGALTLAGPLRAERVVCRDGAIEQPFADVSATLAEGFVGWRGDARLRSGPVVAQSLALSSLQGRITFSGSARNTAGDLSLAGSAGRVSGVAAQSLSASGRYRLGTGVSFDGLVRASSVAAPRSLLATLARQRTVARATPIGPLVERGADALTRAAQDFDLAAQIAFDGGALSIRRLDAAAASGARALLLPTKPVPVSSGRPAAFAGVAHFAGGGLPEATIRFTPSGDTIRGTAVIAPYAAHDARLSLDTVRFAWGRDVANLQTTATLSGPLPNGRVAGLRLPIVATWRSGALAIDPGCTALSFDRLTLATVRLQSTRIPVCADGTALVTLAEGRVGGGAHIANLRVQGAIGASPLVIAATDARIGLADASARARDVTVRLGAGGATTRLDLARFSGAVLSDGLRGRLDGFDGQIGKVPLRLSDGVGDWTFRQGALSVEANATLADADAAEARFKPLRADAIRFRLAGSAIEATGTLRTPGQGARIAEVRLAHDLARGAGEATLAAPGVTFTQALQPDALTPLTFGVIADVRGTVAGDAHIAWSPSGVTSTGTFHTDGLDLAAAFGPVRGLAGAVRFTDLLSLESAPGQIATVASVNPGVPVEDGRVVYRLLAGGRVDVASGHWPFAGGMLDLRPTTLDFGGGASERRLTFVLTGVDAGRFLQQFDFDNISATGTFDGTLPMIFDESGGRIEGGELRVRPGGGNLAYLGELTKKDLGTWGDLAFQALRSIDYRDLEIVMNGPLAGEMVTEVRFAGISQGKGAKSNLLIRRLQKLPFVFNIHIRAPFRGLIDSAQSFYDPSRLISRNLPALIRQQNQSATPIQPGASDPGP